jgi:hypothetical protein
MSGAQARSFQKLAQHRVADDGTPGPQSARAQMRIRPIGRCRCRAWPRAGSIAPVADRRDPRRFGIAAATVAGAYTAAIFIPVTTVAVIVGVVVGVGGLALASTCPLPRWREARGRKRTAAWAMTGEAIAIAAVATIVRVLVVR